MGQNHIPNILPFLDSNRQMCYGFVVDWVDPEELEDLPPHYPTFEELAVDPTSRLVLLEYLHG